MFYVNKGVTVESMKPLFDMIEALREVKQGSHHHPEVNALNHTLQVFSLAVKEEDCDLDLILAALLHDVGKAKEILHHDTIGAEMIRGYVTDKVVWLVENHLRIIYYLEGKMKKKSKCRELAGHRWFPKLVMLRRWDILGRKPGLEIDFDKEKIVKILNEIIYREWI